MVILHFCCINISVCYTFENEKPTTEPELNIFVCRLLAYGGAKVFTLKLPATNPEAESEKLTYLFTDPSKAQLACDLQKCGVMCLNVDFLSDFLILVSLYEQNCKKEVNFKTGEYEQQGTC